MRPRARISRMAALLGASLTIAVVASSCADPVHDALVTSLGPEDPSIPAGEYHRAGQPCTACHGPEGPAKTEFALAGTIFWAGGVSAYSGSVIGVNEANVQAVDSLGTQISMTTNCVGNFWVPAAQQPVAFPILVAVNAGASYTARMATQIGRATSCAECHSDPINYNSPGHIYLTVDMPPEDPVDANASTCAVDPNLADGPTTGAGLQ